MTVNTGTDQFLLDAYTGEGGFSTGAYLIQHPREMDDKFTRRKELSVYLNYCRKVVDAYLGTIFNGAVTRTGEATAWVDWQSNADGAGLPVDRFMRRAELLSMLLGTVYIAVDRPRGEAVTRADEANMQPYAVLRMPSEVHAVTLNEMGRVTEITFIERDEDGDKVYRHWDDKAWWLANEADGSDKISEGEHGLGQVPVVRLHSTELLTASQTRATPWAKGLAKLGFDLFNQWSERRELLRSQTFSVLTLPVSDPDEAQKLNDLTISTENALTYNPTGGGKPDYIAPPDHPVAAYDRTIADTVQRIYELANLEFVGGVQQSGVALAFHFQAANRTLSDMAENLDQAEIEVGRLVCAWMGQDWDGHVSYPKKFDLVDLQQRLTMAMDAMTLGLGEEFTRALKRTIAREVLGDTVDPQVIERIDAEIDAAGDTYGDRVDKEAQNGGAS